MKGWKSRTPGAVVLAGTLTLAGLLSIALRVRVSAAITDEALVILYPAYFVAAVVSGAIYLGSPRVAVLPLLGCVIALVLGPSFIEQGRRSHRTTSCANHILQSASLIRSWSDQGKAFEDSTDFEKVLASTGMAGVDLLGLGPIPVG